MSRNILGMYTNYFDVEQQSEYSKGELLIRTFFGWFYIGIPHGLFFAIFGFISAILSVVAWFSILINEEYPEKLFAFQVKMLRWRTRFYASIFNLVDGYPGIGPEGEHTHIHVNLRYPEQSSRTILLMRTFLGWLYVLIPHGFILFFRVIIGFFLTIVAFIAVLLHGDYPQSIHRFNVETMRWAFRVAAYMLMLSDDYPPFNGKEMSYLQEGEAEENLQLV